MSITVRSFGQMPDGRAVKAYTLDNGAMQVTILNLGGIVQSIVTPDKNGQCDDIVCGFDTVEGYLTGGGYQGALIGRYGNRIAGGKFPLNGRTYTLFCNDGDNSLHGGREGFNVKLWNVFPLKEKNGLLLTHFSPDGDEGYPGNVEVSVTYLLGDDNTLTIRYEATTDEDTILNLTNHSYFNLKGYRGGDVLDVLLRLNCDRYNAVNDALIPEDEPASVEGTAFDFRTPRAIGQAYDHNFLRTESGFGLTAEAVDPVSGRTLTCATDMPGVQLYTASCMDGEVPFKGGVPQRPLHAFCLETQYAPDTPNHPGFPSCVVRAGEAFLSTTVFTFGVRK